MIFRLSTFVLCYVMLVQVMHTQVYNICELAGWAAHCVLSYWSILPFHGFSCYQVPMCSFPWQIFMFTLIFWSLFLNLLKLLLLLLYSLPHSGWKRTSVFTSVQILFIICVFQIRMRIDSYGISLDADMLITYFACNACFLSSADWEIILIINFHDGALWGNSLE